MLRLFVHIFRSFVQIPRGHNFGKQLILSSLEDYTESELHPVFFRFEQGDAVFFLEDTDVSAVGREMLS